MRGWEQTLYLEKGYLFEGEGFGAETAQGGEAVFNTGMTGYQEIFTDPSYHKQIVVMGYPHIGNTGVNEEDLESKSVFLAGVVVREIAKAPSSWRMKLTLDDYLKAAEVPGIAEVDTREITQILRDEGAQRGIIFPTKQKGNQDLTTYAQSLLRSVDAMEGLELVSQVSCRQPYEFREGLEGTPVGNIVVYDFGVKTNILRFFSQNKFKVTVVPYNYPYEETLALDPTAVVLSNGPGDPAEVRGAVEQIQGFLGRVPTLAICMGHQLLARSLGAKTYKLKFGHHGINHPVKDLTSGKIMITSQNHGFSVKASDLSHRDVKLSHVSLNDQTVEGFYSEKMKFYSVQFHPEAKPGPNDAASIFDYFVRGFLQ